MDPTGLAPLVGTATCDSPGNKTCSGTWCSQTYSKTYPNVRCNLDPCTKACTTYESLGMTGAFPNLAWNDTATLKTCCPNKKIAKSRCNFIGDITNQSKVNKTVSCGDTIKVSKGKCFVNIKILDDGPAAWTGNLVDLHPMAAQSLFACLNPRKKFTCKNFKEANVTVS